MKIIPVYWLQMSILQRGLVFLMQKSQNISLNAVRVFLTVAQHNSIKDAASDMNVTSGAISHQVRALEDALGIKLFSRRNNSIALTDAGTRLMRRSMPGLLSMQAALDDVARDAHELRVRASMTFASRWLIPRLNDFKKRNPRARLRLETFFAIGDVSDADADVIIAYYKRDHIPTDAIILFEDNCRPYVAPALLDAISDPTDLGAIPALCCSQENWDWKLWLSENGLSEVKLKFAEHFDLDDAALRAAAAGMGMVLASTFMSKEEVSAGQLCPLPDSAEATLGAYVVHQADLETSLSRRFVHWLRMANHLPDFERRKFGNNGL